MMKKHIGITLIFLWLLGMSFSYGQPVDSLKQLLPNQKGIERIDTLNELAWELGKIKDSVGIKYALEALKLSKKQSYYKGISDAYNRLGGISKYQKDIAQAKKYYLKALTIDKKEDYFYGIARANNQLGLIYKREGNKVIALEYYLLSLNAFEKTKQYTQASKAAGNIGDLYFKYDAYDKVLEYYSKQLEYSLLAKNATLIAKSYRNLGGIQKEQKNYSEALDYFQKAEKIYIEKKNLKEIANSMVDIATTYDYLNQNEIAKKTFIKALDFIEKHKVGDKGALHHNLATLYRKLGQTDSASYHYQKGLEIFEKSKNKKKLLIHYNNVGNVHYDNREFKKALANLNQSLALQHTIKDSTMLGNTYTSISNVYRELKEYQNAYKYKDSAYKVSRKEFLKIKKGDRLEVDYVNAKADFIKAENKKIIAESIAEKRKIQVISLLIVLLLISILFFYVTKARKQRQQRMLAEADLTQQRLIVTHEKEMQQQELQELIKTQEMKAINAMINGQEEERKRIAQDLHDNLGSKLSLVKIHYQSVEDNLENVDDETKVQYENANLLLDEACKSVREISHNMLSGTLSKFGLMPALKELKQTIENACYRQNQQKISIELTSHKFDDRLENTMEIEIYRIIQELLNNIIKHAEASQVAIQILKRNNEINIIVEDNGIGFDISNEYLGFGLKTVESRVIKMNGNCNIDSGKGNGTTVTIDIPT